MIPVPKIKNSHIIYFVYTGKIILIFIWFSFILLQ